MHAPAMSSTSSSRILYDVPCAVCEDNSSGKHYGVFACDGCAGFFKRSVRRQRIYACKARSPGSCAIDKTHRNQCRSCRLAKCLDAGMSKDSVQHERGPRNSTIRRQMAMFSKDMPSTDIGLPIAPLPTRPAPPLPLSAPLGLSLFSNPFLHFNRLNLFNTPSVIGPPVPTPIFPIISNFICEDPESASESAARILFVNVNWAKSVHAFETLSMSDRLLLLSESWAELFVIGCAQFMYPVDLNAISKRRWASVDRTQIEIFESVLNEIARTRPDPHEFSFLRGLVLFKTSFNNSIDIEDQSSRDSGLIRRLQDLPAVAEVQCQVQTFLNHHSATVYAGEFARASQLYQLLRMLKTVSGDTIIELFFRSTIGNITVERIITDMYRSGRIPVIPFNY